MSIESDAKKYREHLEAQRVWQKNYYAKNREKILARYKAWSEVPENRKKLDAYRKNYYQTVIKKFMEAGKKALAKGK